MAETITSTTVTAPDGKPIAAYYPTADLVRYHLIVATSQETRVDALRDLANRAMDDAFDLQELESGDMSLLTFWDAVYRLDALFTAAGEEGIALVALEPSLRAISSPGVTVDTLMEVLSDVRWLATFRGGRYYSTSV